jgi:hypothetical protein
VTANASGGLLLKNLAGTTVMTVGPGSGTGVAFNSSGLTGVNSVTAASSTALTLAGGSTGASLVLGSGNNLSSITTPSSKSATLSFGGGGSTVKAYVGTFSNSGYFTSNWYYDGGQVIPLSTYSTSGISILSSLSANGSLIDFLIGTVNTAPTPVARITGNGNLLIGTTTDISGTGGLRTAGVVSAAGGVTAATQIQATAGAALNLQNSASDAQANILNIGGSGASIIDFRTASTSRLTIGAAGPVGITSTATATASSAGGGALQVGSNVGLSGNAGGASYFGGNTTTGLGSASTQINLNGSGSGTNGGASFNLSNNSGGILSLGNTSNIIGGAYSAVPMMYFIGSSFRLHSGLGAADVMTASSGGVINIPNTTSASSSTVGALTIGNGTAATNVAIGGGNVNAGGIISATTGGFKGANYLNSTGLTGNIITGDTNQDFYINGSIKMSLSAATTSLSSTTPSTGVGFGALQVAGGIYAGAASVFGGDVRIGGPVTSSYAGYQTLTIGHATNGGVLDFTKGGFVFGEIAGTAAGLTLTAPQVSTDILLNSARNIVFSPALSTALTLTGSTLAATFAGAVTGSTTISATTQFQSDTYRQLSGNRSLLSFTGVQTTVGSGATGDTTRIMANGVQALGFDTALVATFAGAVSLSTAGTTVSIKSGTNAAAGTVTLTGGAGTITSTAIDVNTVIVMSVKTSGGTIGDHTPSVKVNAGNAVITGSSSDTSTYNWIALKVN